MLLSLYLIVQYLHSYCTSSMVCFLIFFLLPKSSHHTSVLNFCAHTTVLSVPCRPVLTSVLLSISGTSSCLLYSARVLGSCVRTNFCAHKTIIGALHCCGLHCGYPIPFGLPILSIKVTYHRLFIHITRLIVILLSATTNHSFV